jgi:hypothetical protein
MKRLTTALSLAIFPLLIYANADVELISVTSPGGTGFVPPTVSIKVEFKFRNNGPDTIASSSSAIAASFTANVGMRTIDVFRSTRIQPCRYLIEVFDDGPNSLSASVGLILERPLPPGETISCYANLGVYQEAPPSFTQDFFAVAPNNNDPDFSNNRKTITIRTRAIPPVVTSVPLSNAAYILTGLMMLGFGIFAARRQ